MMAMAIRGHRECYYLWWIMWKLYNSTGKWKSVVPFIYLLSNWHMAIDARTQCVHVQSQAGHVVILYVCVCCLLYSLWEKWKWGWGRSYCWMNVKNIRFNAALLGISLCRRTARIKQNMLGISKKRHREEHTVGVIYLCASPVVFADVYPFSDIHVTPRVSSLLQQLPASGRRRRWSWVSPKCGCCLS